MKIREMRIAKGLKQSELAKILQKVERFDFGTTLMIDGHLYTVEDRGGAVKGNKVDIFFDSHAEALAFGKQKVKVYEVRYED